jgi:hypothetical protein
LAATARTFTARMTGPWRDKVFNAVPATATPDFADKVARCYPFHPQLMALAEQEWAKLAWFQIVRSTIRVFAATAYALHKRGKSSFTDETKRDSVRLLLRNLANAIDEGKASYAQLMVKVIVDSSVVDGIAEDVRSTGTTPTVKKV